jgi:hypothetical protein
VRGQQVASPSPNLWMASLMSSRFQGNIYNNHKSSKRWPRLLSDPPEQPSAALLQLMLPDDNPRAGHSGKRKRNHSSKVRNRIEFARRLRGLLPEHGRLSLVEALQKGSSSPFRTQVSYDLLRVGLQSSPSLFDWKRS